tara:strand:+ start:795 stop:2189 length:1395 start_codon:yes stop_codon:yes gene_type:complete
MSAAAQAIAKLYALQKAGKVPEGAIRRAFFGTKTVTPGLTQGTPEIVGPIPGKSIRELLGIAKSKGARPKTKLSPKEAEFVQEVRAVVGQGKATIDVRGLSKKEIKELIDLGFPIQVSDPQRKLSQFNPLIPSNRPQLKADNLKSYPDVYKPGEQLLLRDAGLGKLSSSQQVAKALNEEGRTAAKALARLSTSIKKSKKQSISDIDMVSRWISQASPTVQGQVLDDIKNQMNPAAFALLTERVLANRGLSASRVLDRVQKGQSGKNISRARQKEFDIQGPQIEGQDETSFVKSYLEQKVDQDTRQVVNNQVFEDDFFFVDPVGSKARAREADILLDDVVGTPTTYDPIRRKTLDEAIELPEATKQAVLSSFGSPAEARTELIARDIRSDLPIGSKLSDVKESRQVLPAMKLGLELPKFFAKQRLQFPRKQLLEGQANIAGARVPNPLEFLSATQIKSVLRTGGI